MGYAGWGRESEYGRLKAEYDAAFAELRAAQPSIDQGADQAAERRFQQALVSYRESRGRLAKFLAGLEPMAGGYDEVRALAHRLWEEEGRPIGNPEHDWYRAEALVRIAAQQ